MAHALAQIIGGKNAVVAESVSNIVVVVVVVVIVVVFEAASASYDRQKFVLLFYRRLSSLGSQPCLNISVETRPSGQ